MNAIPNYMEDSIAVNDNKVWLICSQCRKCQNTFFPARERCTECISIGEMEPKHIGPKGILYSYTIVHVASPSFNPPYVVGYVDFPENVRVFGQIEIPNDQVEELKTGIEVSLKIGQICREDNGNLEEIISYKFIPTT